MLNIDVTRSFGKVVSARVVDAEEAKAHYMSGPVATFENRNDWKTFEAAKEVADRLEGYIATDAGPHVSPRYDVIRLPKVGDKVSKEFNGDSYPCGVIVKISKTLKAITTDGGDVFYRIRQTGAWRNQGTWSLTKGHVEKQNPSF
jgi:hypothetical protein